jgi:hypothetical protein
VPYIEQIRRDALEYDGDDPETVGDLNFVITRLMRDYALRKGTSYQTHNDIIGVLECAKLEWYRRCTSPYEDYKCDENGDAYV